MFLFCLGINWIQSMPHFHIDICPSIYWISTFCLFPPFHHAFLEINELRISRSSFHRLQLYWVTWIAASQRCSSNSSHTRRVIDFMYRWFLNPCQWRPASLNAYMKFYIFFKGICKWCLFGNADHHQGSPGQGNYSAANMALDAHARYWKVRFWWCLVESRYNQIGYDDIIRISLHDWCEQVESNQYSHGDIQFLADLHSKLNIFDLWNSMWEISDASN